MVVNFKKTFIVVKKSSFLNDQAWTVLYLSFSFFPNEYFHLHKDHQKKQQQEEEQDKWVCWMLVLFFG